MKQPQPPENVALRNALSLLFLVMVTILAPNIQVWKNSCATFLYFHWQHVHGTQMYLAPVLVPICNEQKNGTCSTLIHSGCILWVLTTCW